MRTNYFSWTLLKFGVAQLGPKLSDQNWKLQFMLRENTGVPVIKIDNCTYLCHSISQRQYMEKYSPIKYLYPETQAP